MGHEHNSDHNSEHSDHRHHSDHSEHSNHHSRRNSSDHSEHKHRSEHSEHSEHSNHSNHHSRRNSSDHSDRKPSVFYTRNLVTNSLPTFNAVSQDTNLINSWGIAIANDSLWVADNGSNVLTNYDFNGHVIGSPVTGVNAGTGIAVNKTSGFNIVNGSNNGPALLLVGSETGVVYGYNGAVSSAGIQAVAGVSGSTYKGLTIANGQLFVANFGVGLSRVEVYDSSFAPVTLSGTPFVDPGLIPSSSPGYAPFNIAYIDGFIYVVYALQNGSGDDVAGAGHGYVSIFQTNGTFVRRFISGGNLNSPWGIMEIPSTFGFPHDAIVVGNFGDGKLNVYDRNGNFLTALKDVAGNPIVLPGLWGLVANQQNSVHIFWASGPNAEADGLIGSLKRLNL